MTFSKCHCTFLHFRHCGHNQLLISSRCKRDKNTHSPSNVLCWDDDCLEVSGRLDFVLPSCQSSPSGKVRRTNDAWEKILKHSSQRVYLPDRAGKPVVPNSSREHPGLCCGHDVDGFSCTKMTFKTFCEEHETPAVVMPTFANRELGPELESQPIGPKKVRFQLPYSKKVAWEVGKEPETELEKLQEIYEECTTVYNAFVRHEMQLPEMQAFLGAQDALMQTEISWAMQDVVSVLYGNNRGEDSTSGDSGVALARQAAYRGELFRARRKERVSVHKAREALKGIEEQLETVKDGRTFSKMRITQVAGELGETW